MGEASSGPNPSVFISYAHKDGMDFTRRLAYALNFYADTFFDIHLQSGEYPPQLYHEIEQRSHFVFVMTPYSLASEWCRRELARAQEKRRDGIVLVKVFPDCGDAELEGRYTYGDFVDDFEKGFRHVTEMILGSAYSSWEAYAGVGDNQLIAVLQRGLLPGVIAKEIAEWIIVEQLWPPVEKYAANGQIHIFRGFPRTPFGILRQCEVMREQFATYLDALGIHYVDQAKDVAELYARQLYPVSDTESIRLGSIAFQVYSSVKSILRDNAVATINAVGLDFVKGWGFDFGVAEKLRELINMHARRSRYLY